MYVFVLRLTANHIMKISSRVSVSPNWMLIYVISPAHVSSSFMHKHFLKCLNTISASKKKSTLAFLQALSSSAIFKHHLQALSSSTIFKHYLQALSSSTIFKHYLQALSSSAIFKRYLQALSSSAIFKHYLQALSSSILLQHLIKLSHANDIIIKNNKNIFTKNDRTCPYILKPKKHTNKIGMIPHSLPYNNPT